MQCEQEEAEKCMHKGKGKEKEKVYGMSVRYGALLTMFVQEVVVLMLDNNTGSQQPKRKRRAGRKGLA